MASAMPPPASPLREPLLPAADGAGEAPLAGAPSELDRLQEALSAEAEKRAAEAKAARRRELKGLGLNALSTVFGTGMSLCAKISGTQGIGVFEIVLTRSLILVLATGPELAYHKVNPFRDRNRRWLLVLRGVLGFLSVSSLYLAVALLPLADASVLSFLSPLFVAVLSPLVLKERPSRGTLVSIPMALVGVVLVAHPSFVFGGGGGISALGIGVGVAQALFNSLARMAVRALSLNSSERMSSIIFGQGIISVLGSGVMCAATRRFVVPYNPRVWAALLIGGFLGYLYQLALTAGLQRARAAPAVAMSYLSVLWGMAADVWVFHDLPEPLSLVGAGIICLSSFAVAFTQKKAAAAKTAGGRWEASVARLQAEPLLGTHHSGVLVEPDEVPGASDDEEEGSAHGAGAYGASPGSRWDRGSSDEEWASAREGGASRASSAGTGTWWDAAGGASASPPGTGSSLKDELKEAVVAAAAAAEVPQPDTPAAPPPLVPHPGPGSSAAASLAGCSPTAASAAGSSSALLLSSSPGAGGNLGGAAGGQG